MSLDARGLHHFAYLFASQQFRHSLAHRRIDVGAKGNLILTCGIQLLGVHVLFEKLFREISDG
jgi:hypothetical protein